MFRRILVLAFGLLLAAFPAFAARPNVILITLDTTRADRMGFLGSKRGLTPNLDTLAANSIVFTRAYSQAPITTASHASILTGTYPQFHRVADAGLTLAADLPYAPQIFHDAGYRTAAFVGSVILDPKNGGAPGFERGFDFYDAGFRPRAPGEDRYQTLSRRADEVVERALKWLKSSGSSGKTPFFVWIHLYDPHEPYDPPEPFATRYRAEPYDGEIAYSDSALGKLFAGLKAAKLYDGSAIAFMADHGEGLGDHGEMGHGVFLYDSTIHVPLLVKLPAERAAGKRIPSRVELVDVLPTVLEAAGVATPKAVQGHSLINLLSPAAASGRSSSKNSGDTDDPPAYSETDYPQRAFGWSYLRSLRTGKYLFVDAPRPEMYDQSEDPAANTNLATTSPAVSATLAGQLAKFGAQTESHSDHPEAHLTPEQQAKLHALGYADSGSHESASQTRGADPKDKILLANDMTDIYFLMEEFRNQEAITKSEEVVAKDPTIAGAWGALGEAWMHLGDFPKALPALKKAAELQPDSAFAHYQYGVTLIETGNVKSALPELEAASVLSPDSGEILYALAFVYSNGDRLPEARKLLEKAREVQPAYFEADVLLGSILLDQKDAAAALPILKEAIALRPDTIQPHEYAAAAYAQLGDQASADRETAAVSRLKQANSQ